MADKTKVRLGSVRGSWVVRGVLAGTGLVGLAVAWFAFAQSVQADQFGVRQIYFGPNRGVQEGPPYEAGLHLVVPGYERMHVFPRDLQTMDFNDEERSFTKARLGDDYHWAPSIRIQTSEGYQVTVDVTVLYRIVDPYTVLTKVGPGRLFETQVVQRRADQVLRQSLGALNAEEFYDEVARLEAVDNADATLTAELASWGLEVWGVLLREYNYDDRYQAAIEERKIQDQRVFKNQAEGAAATRQAERDRVIAEGQAIVQVEAERGRAEVRRINAEADLYYRQKVAEGDLLVALAEAKGTELENDALRVVGAANLVGLEMAKALEGVEVIMVSTTGKEGVNPLDLDTLVGGF